MPALTERERDGAGAELVGDLQRAGVAGGQQGTVGLAGVWFGPTTWITQRAGMSPAVVQPASPVARPCGKRRRQSSSTAGPPARWIAPSTPPPPRIARLAALTTASTSCSVMSPSTDGDPHQDSLSSRSVARSSAAWRSSVVS